MKTWSVEITFPRHFPYSRCGWSVDLKHWGLGAAVVYYHGRGLVVDAAIGPLYVRVAIGRPDDE